MKKLKFLAMLLMAMTLSFAFTSCSDDDDDVQSPEIIGTWMHSDSYETETITFNKNGSFELTEVDYYYGETDIETGKYKYSNNTLALTFDEDETEYYTVVSISETSLVLRDHYGDVYVWTRIK
ncbi:MAG: DUF6705 family protein [Muribaculaceae bacterium]